MVSNHLGSVKWALHTGTSIAQKKGLPVLSVKTKASQGDRDKITEQIKDLGRERARSSLSSIRQPDPRSKGLRDILPES